MIIIHSFRRVEDYWDLMDRLQHLQYKAVGFCVTDSHDWDEDTLIYIDLRQRCFRTITYNYYARYLILEQTVTQFNPDTSIFYV